MTQPEPSRLMPQRQLNLFDAVCINVGIIIGSGIFRATPDVASFVDGSWSLIGLWLVGGLIALTGALCYGELATTFPHHGGEYVYLTQGYGRRFGFLFAWAEFWIIRPGNIGAMAYIFGDYAKQIVALTGGPFDSLLYACAAIVVLTMLNLIGTRTTKRTQNILTTAKVAGLIAICCVGFWSTNAEKSQNSNFKSQTSSNSEISYLKSEISNLKSEPDQSAIENQKSTNYQLALIFILFTFGGWNEIAYAAAEVQEPQRNLWRALVASTVAVTLIYVVVNAAFLSALGFEGLGRSKAPAADVMQTAFGDDGRRAISVLICVSCLGAINGAIFTGARISFALGREHSAFRWLGQWDERLAIPLRSVLLQAGVTLALVVGFGLRAKGFEQLVNLTAPVFWFFVFFVVGALFLLRTRPALADEKINRVVLFPITPLVFGASCLFLLYSSARYAYFNLAWEAVWVAIVLIVGIGISLGSSSKQASEAE